MKKTICYILIICSAAFSGDIPGLYNCTSVFVEQYRNGTVYRKRIMIKSLYLNITRNKISVFGMESGRSICRDLEVDQVFRDTLFINPRLERKQNNRARLYFKNDTLAGNYNFLDNGSNDSVAVKILVSKVSSNMLARIEKQCR